VAMTRAQGRDGAVVLGLVAPSGVPRELADQIAAELPGELAGRLGDVNWQVRVGGAERADMTPTSEALKRSVRSRMQDEGWDLAVGLTDLPLRANRRPVIAHASAMYRVRLLSVPALGARSAPRRAMQAVLNLVEGLLGEKSAAAATRARRGAQIGCASASTSYGRRSVAAARMRTGRSRSSVRRGATCGCSSAWSREPAGARHRAPVERAGGITRDRRLRDELLQHLDALSRDGVAASRPPRSGVDHHVVRGPGAGTRLMGAGVRAEGPRSRRPLQPHDVRDSGARGPHVLRRPACAQCRGWRGPHPAERVSRQRRHAPAVADYLKLGWLIESDEAVREAGYRHHPDERTEGDEDDR
jgi:hypothetical protein